MIAEFKPEQQNALTAFVLGIQHGAFGLGLKKEEQPDLINTAKFYHGKFNL